ncbi:Chromosome partition protein Smc [Kordia antarctica]|uniref:Chromosome partition protein Smc n=1 Tax=Kordia antarctica TaxID=1218801 RepID=A0A7L4ZI37_9FLAO|nr:SbcC/MukB-like Walker B domain-containing protein [Kordia antarctica]QHI36398.1 Chromosome partition protein Smc [Kordia antarctica]
MSSLFSTVSSEAGFRLQYMEILNWGTFDEEIYRIEPKGNNSLLTGVNGSGKTTFVDALLTLIVPLKNSRFYNQSSGSEKKGDRSEKSYVLGHYGDIQREDQSKTTSQRLRDTSCYSILLANFENTDGKSVTLFQVRWFSGNEMKRSFGIGYIPLGIAADFQNFDGKGLWKKLLDKKYNSNSTRRKLEFFDGPTQYANRIIKLFGMRSLKALDLFNKLVGIKVLGDLDRFIRNEMLESKDAEEEYKALENSFVNLMDAQNNIKKAKEQIKQLEPINTLAEQLEDNQEKLESLKFNRDTALYWFAKKGKELCESEKSRLANEIDTKNKRIKILKVGEGELKKEIAEVAVQIEKDEVGQQIEKLKTQKSNEEVKTSDRKNALQKYNIKVGSVSFPKNPSRKIFEESLRRANEEIKNIKVTRPKKEEAYYNLKTKIEEKEVLIKEAVNTVETLLQSGNNITGRVAQIRNEIINAVGATKEEIPFIGELISIKDTEVIWELAIEKALHNFGLKLIVPEAYYDEVNKYVNQTNLRGKITYERFRDSFSMRSFSNRENDNENYLVNKLQFKATSKYSEWVEQNVTSRFNFLCAENMSAFSKADKAITKKGLTKFGKGRHEKDDRKQSLSKERYVLGWDNSSKINYWRNQVQELREEVKILKAEFNSLESTLKEIDDQKNNLNHLIIGYPTFNIIDWASSAKEFEALEKRIRELKETNHRIKALEKEKELLNGKLIEKEKEREGIVDERADLKPQLTTAEKLYNENAALLNSIQADTIDLSNFGVGNTDLENIVYANFELTRNTFQNKNNVEISKLEAALRKLEKDINDKIRQFRYPTEKIKKDFPTWMSDVSHLSLEIELISAYQEKYNELKENDLPKFQKKFDDYLEETLTNKVGEFKEFFDSWSEEIKENIKSLNKSLEGIDFASTPQTTYIQLKDKAKKNDLVDEFKEYLRKAIPNFKEIRSKIGEEKIHFENAIEPFIKKLRDEKWREKVMDVRTWYEYKIEEFYREDNSKKNTYEGMGQLSGGEKAQLTYTVLGSAIAYQFGLTKTGTESDSFRFIAIDEAFKAQDAKKANYLINLCKQLHLQLLVVTPSDNIDIVEDHISFVHFVTRKNDRNSWLYDMPIDQFRQERDKYLNS